MTAPVAEKINVIDYVPLTKLPLLKRIVKWYRDTPIIPKFVKAGVAYVGPTILGILSLGLLLPFIFKIKDYSYQLDLEAANDSFQKAVKNKIAKGEVSPPSDAPIALKSDKQTFNHVNDYVIKDGIIWYRRHMGSTQDKAWKPIFFDGAAPMKISADGANLTVVDSAEKVHYRKVLIEARGYAEIHRHRLERHLNNSALKNNFNAKDDKDTYVAIDKTEKANWKEKWYSLPVLNRIVNFFTGNRLTVHGQMAHSHRGRFDEAYSDVEGNLHQASIGVTTSYELETDGTGILKHDPWVTTLARVHFYFPETNGSAYVAKRLDASGSSLLAVGYTVDRKSGQGKLKILSNLCDIDILGGNPLLNYAYHTEHNTKENMQKKNLRVLPDQVKNEGWIDETLPEGATEFYNQISILQERRGKRELRIAAKDQAGVLGYYHKTMKSNDKWEFTPHEGIDQSEPLPLITQIQQTLKKGPGHYEGTIKNKKASATIEIDHFGERAYHSDVKMKLDGQDYNLALHRRWGWQTFFGGKRDSYELVVPDTIPPENNRKVTAFFDGKRVIPVKVKTTNEHNQERVTITPK